MWRGYGKVTGTGISFNALGELSGTLSEWVVRLVRMINSFQCIGRVVAYMGASTIIATPH